MEPIPASLFWPKRPLSALRHDTPTWLIDRYFSTGLNSVAMLSFRQGRMGQVLTLALTVAWLAAAACADARQMPTMHHRPMRCCPPNAGTEQCSSAQCEQTPEKTEAQNGERTATLHILGAELSGSAVTLRAAAIRELTPGLRFGAAVFRLKDDLRI